MVATSARRAVSAHGRRRVQRRVRVTVAAALLLLAAVVVAAAIVTSTLVAGAAVLSVLAGATSSRIVWTEVVQTRRDNAIERAEMARDFGAAMTKSLAEHRAYTQNVNARLASKDKTIVELNGTIRLAEKRAEDAESRIKREVKRANAAQERLSVLLDEVLTANADLVEEEWASAGIPEAAELPTIVDLLAWEDRVNESIVEDLRHQA